MITVVQDADAVGREAAERFVVAAERAVAERNRFDVVLTGGATAPRAYRELAAEPLLERLEGSRMHVYWSDERCVPAAHPDSNYGAARDFVLDTLTVPGDQVHRMRGEDPDPGREAERYAAEIRNRRFDLVLLSIGADGHVASIFPGSSAAAERERWVVAIDAEIDAVQPPRLDRLTLAPPALAAAREVIVLAAEASKASAVAATLEGPSDPARWPGQHVVPGDASRIWILDRAAATELENP